MHAYCKPAVLTAWRVLGMCQIVVASKFDNRLKEFGERWEVDRYLSAAGYLSANVKPFFVALPKVSKSSQPYAFTVSVLSHVDALQGFSEIESVPS